ncbi:MAG TPA: sulfatase [Planctomycetota bacterium]|nr:sulfatase [Planctomycetota bacterium]
MRITLALFALLAGVPPAADEKVNIIHIIGDDVGYDDLSCFGSKDIATPNLDALAKEGMRLTSFYAPASTCTPSRAAILTGRYAPRVQGCERVLFPNDKQGIEADKEVTIATLLRKQGYATALVGKWHLGCTPEHLPTNHGFDLYLGIPYPNDHGPLRNGGKGDRGFPPIPLYRGTKIVEQPTDLASLPERFVEESVKFITENKDRPFFLHLANIETHTPWFVSKKFQGKSKAGRYGDAVECMDWMVGEVVATLKKLDLEKKTLLVFTSDNGPLVKKYEELEACYGDFAKVDTSRTHVVRDGKYQARYEGGTRVPMIARWPGKIPAGASSAEIAAGFDLFATFAAVAGVEVPKDRVIDGRNILPLLRAEAGATSPHAAFYGTEKKLAVSVREGPWKFVASGSELYNLDEDLAEKTNRASAHPEIVERLKARLAKATQSFQNDRPLE